jgi:hypothetical protein
LRKEAMNTVTIVTTIARRGVEPNDASQRKSDRTGREVESAYPATRISNTWNAKAKMLNKPVYHPERIVGSDPFGASTAAKSPVRIVNPTAKM